MKLLSVWIQKEVFFYQKTIETPCIVVKKFIQVQAF